MNPAALVTNDVFRRPAFGKHHPLSTGRQGAVLDLIAALGWWDEARIRQAPVADRATLLRFHDAHYIDALEAACERGAATAADRTAYNLGSLECPIFPNLWERARATVGGSILAAQLALTGTTAFHPGGTHHGRRGGASGFCYFNDPVFAILTLLDAGLGRVAYLDVDAHHGDGVEAAFCADRRVFLASLHEEGRWPGTGALAERCDGRALNLPLPRSANDSEYRRMFEACVLPFLKAAAPEAIVITFGADALTGDPLSAMRLSNGCLWETVEQAMACAPAAVVLGGGGYNPWATARLWAGFWGRIAGYDMPGQLDDAARAVLSRLDSDLIEAEDRDPRWLTELVDAPTCGAVRPAFDALIAAAACGGTTTS